MILWAASVGALALALVAAVLLALRLRPHLPVVLALVLGLVVDLIVGTHDKATGAGCGLAQHLARRPWSGLDVALYHVSNALVTLWPAVVAALAWWVFCGPQKPTAPNKSEPREGFGEEAKDSQDIVFANPEIGEARSSADQERPQRAGKGQDTTLRTAVKVIAAAWALANALLVTGPLDAARVQHVLLVVELGAIVAGIIATALGSRGSRWGVTQLVVLSLLAAEVVVVMLGPFRYSVYKRWDLAQVVYSMSFAALAIVQVLAWRRLRPPKAGSPS